ncbi:MAG: HAD hydrolase family protein [Candidatus Omnitrophica bacterium]|nr:HAD hydrolase family protein [Candidatus Omnitrophota bacterium]MCF7893842.1 HAD hydrolase family protein [Candidatus Omnitrophota bacterium]
MKKKSLSTIKKKLAKIKLLILDVDGVLTKEEIVYDDHGRELKMFNVKDGLGVYLLSVIGVKTIFLSAKNSPILKKRAKDMHVVEVRGGKIPKEGELEEIKDKYQVEEEEICFIGDDLIDLGMIEKAGVGIAVKNSYSEVKNSSDYVTLRQGGQGAVREVADLIIDAKKAKKKILQFIKKPR